MEIVATKLTWLFIQIVGNVRWQYANSASLELFSDFIADSAAFPVVRLTNFLNSRLHSPGRSYQVIYFVYYIRQYKVCSSGKIYWELCIYYSNLNTGLILRLRKLLDSSNSGVVCRSCRHLIWFLSLYSRKVFLFIISCLHSSVYSMLSESRFWKSIIELNK